MNRFWLVRSGTTTVDLQPDHLALTIISRQKPRMSIGDMVLFLEGGEQKRFTATAKVTGTVTSGSDISEEPRITRVNLADPVVLGEDFDLDTLWYSLTIVRNTSRPDVHFRRGYRLLPQEDFATIKRGEPFLARSVYLELLNALPQSLRAAFDADQILIAGEVRERVSFRERLERLYAFIDERVLAVGRLLSDLAEAADAVDLGDTSTEHWFVSEEEPATRFGARTDDLGGQLQRFATLRTALIGEVEDQDVNGERGLIDKTLSQLALSEKLQIESQFERLFARAT